MTSVEQEGRISLDALKQHIDTGEIDTIINAICDMQGRLVGKRLTGWYLRDHAAQHGAHFCSYLLGNDMEMNTPDGFSLMGWHSGYGDYVARPDWNTGRIIPWLEKTAMVLADAVDEPTGKLVPVAPRTILRRQIERYAATGMRPRMAMELEYYLLDDSYDDARTKGYDDLKTAGWYSEDYHIFRGTRNESFHGALRNLMTRAGVPVEGSKGEDFGGQHEINVHYADALESADRSAILRHGAKEIAWQQGRSITFMAKPREDWTGSAAHIHVSLWDADGHRSLFPAENGEMSDTMRWFLGGLIAHTRELALFYAPNVNSYKRFAAASWAPVNIIWGHDNRTVGYRIVGHGSALRIECRLPGGDANPYLSYAFLLAAGMAGIEQRIEPPPAHTGNGYLAEGCPRVPRALYEAIEEWKTSELARTSFGDVVAQHYLNAATVEQHTYDRTVTNWERERYFERG